MASIVCATFEQSIEVHTKEKQFLVVELRILPHDDGNLKIRSVVAVVL